MSALPDPAVLDALAGRIAGHATAARAGAVRLSAAIADTHWKGHASEAFRADAGAVVTAVHSVAGTLDDAATALHEHAARVAAVIDEARAGHGGAAVSGPVALARDLLTDPGAVLGGPAASGPQASAMHRGAGMRQDVVPVH